MLEKIMGEKEIKLMDELVVGYKEEVFEFLNDYLFAKKFEVDSEGILDKYGVHLQDISIGIQLSPEMQEELERSLEKSEEDNADYIF